MGRKGAHLTRRQKNLLLGSLKSWQDNQIQQTVIISPGTVIITLIVQTNTGKRPNKQLINNTVKMLIYKTPNLQRPSFLLPTCLFHWCYGHSCRGSLTHQVTASVSLRKKGVRILRVTGALGAFPEGVWHWPQWSFLPWSRSLLAVIFFLVSWHIVHVCPFFSLLASYPCFLVVFLVHNLQGCTPVVPTMICVHYRGPLMSACVCALPQHILF